MVESSSFQKRPLRIAGALVFCLAAAVLITGCSFSSPEQRVGKARQAYEKHDYHAAEVQLKTVLRKHPDNGVAWALLGHTSLAERQYDDAIHQFEKAKANGQPAAALALPLGRALVASGKYQQALKVLNKPEGDSSDHVRALIASLRGDARAGLGDTDKASAAYASALAIEPGLPDALQGQARLALRQGDLKSAHAALSKAVAAHPDDVGSLALLGQVDYRANNCSGAVERLTHAMQVGAQLMAGAQERSARALLADCQLRVGDTAAAQKNIDALLAADQSNPFGNYLQALMDIRQGDYQNAANHVQATLNVDPNNLRSMTLMAWLRIAQGQPDAAQPFLTRVLAQAPDDMAALRLQAGLWMAQNQGEQARDLLAKAYRRHPDQPGLHKALADVVAQLKQNHANGEPANAGIDDISLQLDLARSLAQMGSEAAAQTVLSKIKPSNDAQRRAVAAARVRIALATGKTADALKQAETLARANPSDAEMQKLLAQSYVATARYSDAAQVLAKAHQANPDDDSLVRAQAALAAKRGRYAEAVDELKPLQSAQPDNTDLTLALAALHARAGQAPQGISLLQSAVARQPKSEVLNQALARAYLVTGKAGPALKLIDNQLKSNEKSADWLHLKGVAQLVQGQTDDGLKTLARAAGQAPDRPDLALAVAKAELSYGQRQAGIARLQKLRRQSPEFWPAASVLALAQADAGNTDAALAQVTALRQAGRDFDADVLRGDVLRTAKRFKQADAAYARAYRKKPGARLAMAMFDTRRAGRLDKPAQPLEQWLKQAPGDATAALQLAAWYQQNDQTERAASLYQKVLAAHPGAVIALNNLALINAKSHPEKALGYARKAHDEAPDSAAVTDTLGWMLVSQGQQDSGIALLEAAEKSAGKNSPEIRYHLGVALAARGRPNDRQRAKTLLGQAVAAGLSPDETSHAHKILNRLAGGAGTG
ncbi:XrtA/PEP-CTERM system TPR-repeat protein PrsT [Salinisphaera sp. RV14]|uniref:XrtA/PEP-CTERM system TPR-repeat protein PrsT n=1 Tax=Salinisphaera sp. RV14 TaxID=3454140 RepID=UPI003F867D3F